MRKHDMSEMPASAADDRATDQDHPMLTPEQVATLLNISKATLCRLTKRGEIPHKRLGDRIVRFNLDEIENWRRARA
jgi:excisionase family DNA binding protein